MTWIIGGRYGNHWTEIVRASDREPVVMVRTHTTVIDRKADYAQRTSYEPTPEGEALLAHVLEALNAAEPHATPASAVPPEHGEQA